MHNLEFADMVTPLKIDYFKKIIEDTANVYMVLYLNKLTNNVKKQHIKSSFVMHLS